MRKTMSLLLLAFTFISIMESRVAHANDQAKTVVKNAVAAIFTDFDATSAEKLLKEDYIQHNPAVPTGRAPILGFIPALKASGIAVTTHRLIAEGDYVVAHNTYTNAKLFGAETLVAFDVFRVENGLVAEHWDNLAPLAPPNPSGRSQVDGPTEITDREKTTENKDLVTNFVKAVLVGGAFEKLAEFISTTKYHQHNTQIADGLDGLGAAVAAMAKQGITMKYDTLHLAVAEGNFVFTMSEGKFAGKPTAFFDLFRVEANKIVEHWDVMADIPETFAHSNGKFGKIR